MKRTPATARLALLALGFLAASCTHEAPAPQPQVAKAPAVKREPTPAAALERARQYWAAGEKGDWIATYDMLAPELQRDQPAAAYLQRKANHIYRNMRVTEVVAQKDDKIFLRVLGQWTPNHPKVKEIKLEPGQTLTQDVEMIEIWRWVNDQWCLSRPLRVDEFLEQFPDLQPKSAPPAATPAK